MPHSLLQNWSELRSCQRMMPIAFAIVFLPLLPARASPAFVETTRQFACGPMKLTATTVSTPDRDLYSQIMSQAVILENGDLAVNKQLDLQQHFSRERAFSNARMLDAPGWGWGCTRSRNGDYYLVILFECENPNANSCSRDIQSGSVEWSIVYDELGKALSPENRFFDDAYEQRLKSLGLWESAFQQVDVVGDLFWALDDAQYPSAVRSIAGYLSEH